jgi:O-antigen ligase
MPKSLRWSDLGLGLFGFTLMTAFWPGISGIATTPRWAVASLLPLVWFFLPRGDRTMAHVTGMALCGWLLLSLSWTASPLDGGDAAFKIALAVSAFAVGSSIADVRPLFAGAAIGLAVSSVIAVLQAFGWHGVASIDDTPAGLFANRDRLAAAAAVVMIGCAGLQQWRLAPLMMPALVLANSRAAWLAVGVSLFVWIKRPFWERAVVVLGLTVAVLLMRGGRGLDLATSERLWIWQDTLPALTFFGHGLGSFRELFPTYLNAFAQLWPSLSTPTRPEHPHNELLWLLFEGGVPALTLFVAFAWSCWRACAHDVRAVLVGLFVLAQFAMPLHDPATLILGAVVAGYLAGRGALFNRLSFACRDPLCAGVAAYERGAVGRGNGSSARPLSV